MIKRIGLVLLLVVLLNSVVVDAAISITIKPEALVAGKAIHLGDIAELDGDEPVRIAALRQIYLGPAPPPGGKTSLNRDQLTQRLIGSNTNFSGIEWGNVPNVVAITSGGQILSGQLLTELATEKIQEQLALTTLEETVVSIQEPLADLIAPLGRIDYELTGPGLRAGLVQTAYLIVNSDDVLFVRIPIKYEIRRFAQVALANRTLAARQPLTAQDVQLVRMDVSRMASGYFTDCSEVIGLVSLRALPAGSVIYSYHLEQAVLIKRGDMVVIKAVAGGVEVSAAGVALNDGRKGQLIAVKNSETGRRLNGRVLDKALVQVLVN